MSDTPKPAAPLLVILAFATVYIVWGSTYFFIQQAVASFEPFTLGATRFLIAGFLMLGWSVIQGEKLLAPGLKHALISGVLLLFLGNGIIIWVEQTMPSAVVAIIVSSSPIWFVILDKRTWAENFRNGSVLTGLVIGIGGVLLLFGEQFSDSLNQNDNISVGTMALLVLASVSWAGGSIYSKYNTSAGSTNLNSAWQMLAAGVTFIPGALIRGEFSRTNWDAIPMNAWLSLFYLIIFGSILGFSAYVWLLKVRSAMQVSTYAYVNPVVAVLLGVFLGGESISLIQICGLLVILISVLLINLAKYRTSKRARLESSSTGSN